MHDRPADEEPDERELAADFRARETTALARAYAAYGTLLYSTARRVLGDTDEAQDCVHDALLRIWQRADSYRIERGTLRGFLLVSVRNEALTRKRDAARHARIEERAARAERRDYELDLPDPVDGQRLREAVAALPPGQRAALDLAYFGDLTHVQIARRLDVPLGTAKSRIAAALRRLQSALAPEAGTR